MRITDALWTVGIIFLSGQCSSESFKGKGNTRTPGPIQGANPPIIKTVIDDQGNKKLTFRGAPREPYQVDIIFALDSSPSMRNKVDRAVSNLNNLMSGFLNQMKDYDYQIFLIGQDFTAPPPDPKITRISQYITNSGGLPAAKSLITGSNPKKRADAVKEIVVVSDDDADISVAAFHSWMDEHPEHAKEVHVSGIVAFTQQWYVPLISKRGRPGNNIRAIAGAERTRGVTGDIMQDDWQPIFNQIGSQLTNLKVQPRIILKLETAPADPAKIVVTLNGQPVPSDKVSYDADNQQVLVDMPSVETDVLEVTFQ